MTNPTAVQRIEFIDKLESKGISHDETITRYPQLIKDEIIPIKLWQEWHDKEGIK